MSQHSTQYHESCKNKRVRSLLFLKTSNHNFKNSTVKVANMNMRFCLFTVFPAMWSRIFKNSNINNNSIISFLCGRSALFELLVTVTISGRDCSYANFDNEYGKKAEAQLLNIQEHQQINPKKYVWHVTLQHANSAWWLKATWLCLRFDVDRPTVAANVFSHVSGHAICQLRYRLFPSSSYFED